MKKVLLGVAVLILLSVVATGCQGTGEVISSPTPSPILTATPSQEPVITGVTISDSLDRVREFEQIPKKVISLSPTLTEIIYALGMDEKLVGRTDWCDYPEQVFDVTSVGNMDIPSIETIISLSPDVVVVSLITTEETVNILEDAGIKCVVIDGENTFQGAYTNIEMVGLLLGATNEATTMVDQMKDTVSEITEKIKNETPKTVYYVMGYGEYGDFTAGAGTFISEMISLAGGINVADDTTDWSYSVEKLVEHNPEVLICSMWAPAEGLKEATGYSDLTAVKNDRVITIEDNLMQRIGPRITEGLLEVARALHPTLFD